MNWIEERSQHHKRTYPPSRVLNLFLSGLDTMEISKLTGLTESQACELLDVARKAQPRALAAERMGRAV